MRRGYAKNAKRIIKLTAEDFKMLVFILNHHVKFVRFFFNDGEQFFFLMDYCYRPSFYEVGQLLRVETKGVENNSIPQLFIFINCLLNIGSRTSRGSLHRVRDTIIIAVIVENTLRKFLLYEYH